MQQIIRDRNGKMIATIRPVGGEGHLQIHNRDGIFQGTYRPKLNQTFDRNGKLVGTGNLLLTLLQNK